MKTIILLILSLYLFGCSDEVQVIQSDNISNGVSFEQTYNSVSYEIGKVEGLKTRSILYSLNTLDTNYNGHYCTGFILHYNLTNTHDIDFGNGDIQTVSGVGSRNINLICNNNYLITITFIK